MSDPTTQRLLSMMLVRNGGNWEMWQHPDAWFLAAELYVTAKCEHENLVKLAITCLVILKKSLSVRLFYLRPLGGSSAGF